MLQVVKNWREQRTRKRPYAANVWDRAEEEMFLIALEFQGGYDDYNKDEIAIFIGKRDAIQVISFAQKFALLLKRIYQLAVGADQMDAKQLASLKNSVDLSRKRMLPDIVSSPQDFEVQLAKHLRTRYSDAQVTSKLENYRKRKQEELKDESLQHVLQVLRHERPFDLHSDPILQINKLPRDARKYLLCYEVQQLLQHVTSRDGASRSKQSRGRGKAKAAPLNPRGRRRTRGGTFLSRKKKRSDVQQSSTSNSLPPPPALSFSFASFDTPLDLSSTSLFDLVPDPNTTFFPFQLVLPTTTTDP
jgi:hypothetical protein